MLWLLLLLRIVVCARGSSGSARCPCAQLKDLPPDSTRPVDYGIGCALHDTIYPTIEGSSCSVAPVAEWCGFSWCWIVPQNCTLANEIAWSTVTLGRAWSYQTCGSPDAFRAQALREQLTNATLRTVFLSNSGGWKGSYCDRGGTCRGPVVTFLDGFLSETLNMRLEPFAVYTEVNRSFDWSSSVYSERTKRQISASYGQTGSAFSACVVASALGEVDLCVGAMSITLQREQEGHMIRLFTESIYLVTKDAAEQSTFMENFRSAFRPFTTRLWVYTFITLLVFSLLTLWHEYPEGDFKGLGIMSSVAVAIWDAFMSFTSGASGFEVTNPGARLNNLGLSFFILISISTYTANLASLLVISKRSGLAISGFEDVISGNYRLCLNDNYVEIIRRIHPELSLSQLEIINSRSALLSEAGSSRCPVALVQQQDLQEFNGRGELCEVIRIGDPVFSLDVGVASSEKYLKALDYERASYLSALDSALNADSPPSQCTSVEQEFEDALGSRRLQDVAIDATSMAMDWGASLMRRLNGGGATVVASASGSEGEEEEEGLPLKGMVGPIVLSFLAIGLSLLLEIYKAVRRCFKRGQADKLPSEKMEDGGGTASGRSDGHLRFEDSSESGHGMDDMMQRTSPPHLFELSTRNSGSSGTASVASTGPKIDLSTLIGALTERKNSLEERIKLLSVQAVSSIWEKGSKRRHEEGGDPNSQLNSILFELEDIKDGLTTAAVGSIPLGPKPRATWISAVSSRRSSSSRDY